MGKQRLRKYVLFNIFFFMMFSSVVADENISKDVSKKMGMYEVETIKVTAEKKVQNVQDVPMSLSVFSEANLENANINEPVELMRFAPNVYLRQDSNQNFVVIRGVASIFSSKTSPVGYYIDDVCIPLNGMYNADLVNIERVEILKGPQGTLYGRNSESGVINIITKSPGNEITSKVFGECNWYDAEHGNAPGYKFGGNISGPIIKDKLALGLSGQWKESEGFIKNEYNDDEEAADINNLNGRAHLKWTPDDRWVISFISDGFDYDKGMALFKYTNGTLDKGRHSVSYDSPYNEWTQQGDGQTVKANFKNDNISFTSITGRRYFKNYSASDFDCTSLPLPFSGEAYFEDKDTAYSQEVRLASNDSRKIEWVTGLYFFDEDTDVVVEGDQKKGRELRDTSVDTSGYAFFGQCTYKPTYKLRVTSGLRYDSVDLEGKQLFRNNTGTKEYEKDLSSNEFLPKFSIAYDINSNIMTYTTIAKGYLHGGYNYSKATGLENFYFNEEYTWNYEIGLKSDWLDKKLTANISFFYIEMKDKQVAEWGEITGGGGNIQMIRNAADAHSMGVEFELKARPFYCLDLFAGFGFTESEIDDWVATEYNVYTGAYSNYDYKDKKLPNVPEYNYNFGVQYQSLSGLFARADVFGTGKFYSDAKNTSSEKGYEIVNLKLGFQGEHYEFFCWCKNIFDEEYNKTKFGYGDYEMGVEGDPRMLGITLAYRY